MRIMNEAENTQNFNFTLILSLDSTIILNFFCIMFIVKNLDLTVVSYFNKKNIYLYGHFLFWQNAACFAQNALQP